MMASLKHSCVITKLKDKIKKNLKIKRTHFTLRKALAYGIRIFKISIYCMLFKNLAPEVHDFFKNAKDNTENI